MIASATPNAVATGDTTGGTESYFNVLGTFSGSKNQNFLFTQYLLNLRKSHVAFRQGTYTMPITFTKNDGSSSFSQTSDLCTRIYISGTSVSDNDFLLMSNMWSSSVAFTVPAAPTGKSWVRLIDTSNWAESNANVWTASAGTTISGSYTVNNQSMVLLMAQ
jgi:pullulanase/glycogen debranching enzyme